MRISLLKNHHDKSQGQIITPAEFIKRIKNGEWKQQIELIRKTKTESKQRQLKSKLPVVTLSGVVDNRNLIKPSGFIGIDVDEKDNGKKLLSTIEKIRRDKYVAAVWLSSRGKGFWVLFRINPNKRAESFLGIKDYMLNKYEIKIDGVCKDPARLSYVSYDPSTKFIHNPPIFKQLRKNLPPEKITRAEIDLDELLHISASVVKSQKDITKSYEQWFKVGALCAEAGENGRAVFHNLSRFHNDYNKDSTDEQFNECCKFVQRSKPGERVTIKTLYQFLHNAKIKCPPFKKLKTPSSNVIDKSKMIQLETFLYRYKLWEFLITKTGFKCRGLNSDGVGEFLNKIGIRMRDSGEGRKEFYHIKNNIIEITSISQIAEYVILEAVALPRDIVFCFDNVNDSVGRESILSETQRSIRRVIEGTYPVTFNPFNRRLFLRDTKKETYLKFENVVVKVDKKKIELLQYDKIKKLIWADTIKPFKFKFSEIKSAIEKVLDKAIGGANKESYMTAIGYMINGYAPPSGARILFCCDLSMADGIHNGGNGKDFIAQILNQVRHVTRISAKHLDMTNRFKFQSVNKDTELIWLEDLSKRIRMEDLYNMTDNLNVERKNEMSFSTRIKIGVSLQHTVDMEGTSDKRRQIFLLFTNYFGQLEGGIAKEFGELMDENASDFERLSTFNFLVKCSQLYHQKGIVQMNLKALKEIRRDELGGDMFAQLKFNVKYTRENVLDILGRHNLNNIDENTIIRNWRKWAILSGFELEHFRSNGKNYYMMKNVSTVLKLHRGGKSAKP